MTPVLEALYNKFVTFNQSINQSIFLLLVGHMYDFDICTQHVVSNTFWDGPHIIYVQQLYLYNIMI